MPLCPHLTITLIIQYKTHVYNIMDNNLVTPLERVDTIKDLLLLLLISSYDPYASSSFTSVDKPQVNPQKV